MATPNLLLAASAETAVDADVMRDWRRLTDRELRQECQKGPGEIFLVSHYLYRPFSLHVTKVYAGFGAHANTATLHSCVAALVAAVAVLFPSPLTFVLAAVGLQVYFLLDHVDGELARLWIWTGRSRPNPSGSFFDCWVHYHSVNLVVLCAGIGLTLQSGNVVWSVVGTLAGNLLGNFTKLTLARTLLRDRDRLPHSVAVESLADYATDVEPPVLDTGVSRLTRMTRIGRELLAYPGPLVLLSLTLFSDAAMSVAADTFTALATQAYLVTFAVGGTVVRLVRTARVVQMLRGLEYK
jgi:phosphatidylglycerophosphate synthase